MLIAAVSVVAVFTFMAIAIWSENRRKEREVFYRHETYQKVIEAGDSAESVLALIREDEQRRQDENKEKHIAGLKLAGLIMTAIGISFTVFLFFLDPEPGEPLYLIGFVPLAVGLAISFYAFVLAPRPDTPKFPTQ